MLKKIRRFIFAVCSIFVVSDFSLLSMEPEVPEKNEQSPPLSPVFSRAAGSYSRQVSPRTPTSVGKMSSGYSTEGSAQSSTAVSAASTPQRAAAASTPKSPEITFEEGAASAGSGQEEYAAGPAAGPSERAAGSPEESGDVPTEFQERFDRNKSQRAARKKLFASGEVVDEGLAAAAVEEKPRIRFNEEYNEKPTGGIHHLTSSIGQLNYRISNLQHFFDRHPDFFGITEQTEENGWKAYRFRQIAMYIQNFINAPTTRMIRGEYRGRGCTFFVNFDTHQCVIFDENYFLESGWFLSDEQFANLEKGNFFF